MSLEKDTPFNFKLSILAIPLYAVLLLWVLLWLDFRFNLHFKNYGVYPRTAHGLLGIIASPFIHKNISHLMHNSLPLFVMLMALFYFYNRIAYKILIQGVLISGTLTWIIARPAYHIGASGIVYLLVSFIFLAVFLANIIG